VRELRSLPESAIRIFLVSLSVKAAYTFSGANFSKDTLTVLTPSKETQSRRAVENV
jgi:hypothetical protein